MEGRTLETLHLHGMSMARGIRLRFLTKEAACAVSAWHYMALIEPRERRGLRSRAAIMCRGLLGLFQPVQVSSCVAVWKCYAITDLAYKL